MSKRKTIQVNGHTLSYLQKNETAATILFFIHGNSGAAEMWRSQFNSRKFSSFQFIAFDLPAHGFSGPLSKGQYNVPYMAGLMAAAINVLANKKHYFLVGFSLGANVVAEAMLHSLYPRGIVLISPTVVGAALQGDAIKKNGVTFFQSNETDKNQMETIFQQACLVSDKTELERLIKFYNDVAPLFRPSLFKETKEGNIQDEIEILKTAGVPLLVLFGADDCLVKTAYLDGAGLWLWKETAVKIKGGGHYVSIDHPQPVNKYLYLYINEMMG